ncbi:Flp family type IVb pilin [Jeongeupia naejangsanensis]|uniref:Flp family type IVb pilin n=1 Tax=Jeongeupia naejangsanensis TaxID=613195 RepID=A0ABS2BJT1_9NEIS|nr:Flp family type IVb pilin [Jeongeupia naejangsanensis]MBM3115867.1 Flp family type IVb pilin [Jeongeupia naejangsanensis]
MNISISRLRRQKGATAIEYALVAALIAIVIAVAATTLGTEITAVFGRITTCLSGGACT